MKMKERNERRRERGVDKRWVARYRCACGICDAARGFALHRELKLPFRLPLLRHAARGLALRRRLLLPFRRLPLLRNGEPSVPSLWMKQHVRIAVRHRPEEGKLCHSRRYTLLVVAIFLRSIDKGEGNLRG